MMGCPIALVATGFREHAAAGSSSTETHREMVAVRVETEPTFFVGPDTVPFSAVGYPANLNHREYDVAPDGGRFLVPRPTGEDEGSEWILVLNSFEHLRAAGPTP